MSNMNYHCRATYAEEAFRKCLMAILTDGADIRVRSQQTQELLNVTINIDNPLERYYHDEERHDNPFAKIAETLWVLNGRNDATWLARYLPRALDFADDGEYWRAGYGTRMRHYPGSYKVHDANNISACGIMPVDQLAEVVKLLKNDKSTRRAVMSFWDPITDYDDSKDIPCNDWFHFIIRNGELHLNIAQRSSDIMWGFSGINTFEFSALLEMVAFWVGVPAGSLNWFITSMHLYEQHFKRAYKILEHPMLAYGEINRAKFGTSFEDTMEQINTIFYIEDRYFRVNNYDVVVNKEMDPLLKDWLMMLRLYNMHLNYVPVETLYKELATLKYYDSKEVATMYFNRIYSKK